MYKLRIGDPIEWKGWIGIILEVQDESWIDIYHETRWQVRVRFANGVEKWIAYRNVVPLTGSS